MAKMSADLSLLITCRALFPFMYPDLLENTPQGPQPIKDVRKLRIADQLANLADQDKKLGIHQVADVMRSVFESAQEAGHAVKLFKSDFTGGQGTIGSLASSIRFHSS